MKKMTIGMMIDFGLSILEDGTLLFFIGNEFDKW